MRTMKIKEIKLILAEYKPHLLSLIDKSDEHFEKQLSFIASGALAISFLFIENVIGDFANSSYRYFLFTGWICLVVSLMINLLSHKVASKNHSETLAEIDETLKLDDNAGEYPHFCYDSSRAEKRRARIGKLNDISIYSLIFGIVLILLFAAINLSQKNNNNMDKDKIPNENKSSVVIKGAQGAKVPSVKVETSKDSYGVQGSKTPIIEKPTPKKD